MRNIFRQLKQVDEPVENNEDYNMDYYAGVGRTQTPVGSTPATASAALMDNAEKDVDDVVTGKSAEAVEPTEAANAKEPAVTAEPCDYEEPDEDTDADDGKSNDDDEGYDVTVYIPEDNFSCANIVHDLADGGIVIINISKMNPQTIIRVFDYIMGAVEALDAQLIRRGGDTVVVSPKNIDLDDFCENFTGYEFQS